MRVISSKINGLAKFLLHFAIYTVVNVILFSELISLFILPRYSEEKPKIIKETIFSQISREL